MTKDKKSERIWDKISALYYTYKLGTVTKAAHKLNVSHSAISKHINSLEEKMGEPLTYLQGKNMAFTKKGVQIIEAYENLILQHERTFEQLKRPAGQMQGHFTVSFSPLLSSLDLFEQIATFCEINPSVSFTFQMSDQVPNLAAGDSDIDIRPLLKREDFYDYQYLTTYDMGLYASREYVQKRGILERISDVKDHDGIAVSSQHLFLYAAPEWLALSNWKKLTVITSYSDIFQAIEKGMGIGVLPHTAVQRSRVPLIPILSESFFQSLDLYFHTLQSMTDHQVVKALYTHFRDQPEGPLKGRRKR